MATTHSNLLFHIVFSTKYRRSLIKNPERLYEYIGGIIRKEKSVLIEIGGMPDHVHILVKMGPTTAISNIMRITKTNSSKWFNETYRPTTPFAWQRGFGAFSVSASNVVQVQSYIKNQAEHHKQVSFKEEYRKLLERHQVEFKEEYLFEEETVA